MTKDEPRTNMPWLAHMPGSVGSTLEKYPLLNTHMGRKTQAFPLPTDGKGHF